MVRLEIIPIKRKEKKGRKGEQFQTVIPEDAKRKEFYSTCEKSKRQKWCNGKKIIIVADTLSTFVAFLTEI